MPYDILSDDLIDNPRNDQGRRITIPPFVLHLAIILLLVVIIFIFFMADFSFINKEAGLVKKELSFVGELENFSVDYFGNLTIDTKGYTLTTQNGKFDGNNQEFHLEGFLGRIEMTNRSIEVVGVAQKIKFAKNELNLDGTEFTLISKKRSALDMVFDEIDLNFIEGRFKLESDLNYEFNNVTITVKGFNTSVVYDGTYSFRGTVENMELKGGNDNLFISYSDMIN